MPRREFWPGMGAATAFALAVAWGMHAGDMPSVGSRTPFRPPPATANSLALTPAAAFWQGDCCGPVHVLELHDAAPVTVFIGNEAPGKRRSAVTPRDVACQTEAFAVLNATFHWYSGRGGFTVLGQVARDGVSLVSPNERALRWPRCYFATTWDGRFVIGETQLTTGRLLRQHSALRHVVGGGGWLVREGDPSAWRDAAARQGFRGDITYLNRQRSAVAVSHDGRTAWFATFDGLVSLETCAVWLAETLDCNAALFFDGGETATLQCCQPLADRSTETSRTRPERHGDLEVHQSHTSGGVGLAPSGRELPTTLNRRHQRPVPVALVVRR